MNGKPKGSGGMVKVAREMLMVGLEHFLVQYVLHDNLILMECLFLQAASVMYFKLERYHKARV